MTPCANRLNDLALALVLAPVDLDLLDLTLAVGDWLWEEA